MKAKAIKAMPSARQRPETYRLPKTGSGGDPFFGFSRSFYFLGEKRGYWQLLRICQEGKERGVTLIPYREVLAFVRSQMKDSNVVTAEEGREK